MAISVTILIENTTPRDDLACEGGFCAWIETPETCGILDTGLSGDCWNNADTLGIEIERACWVMLSHGHLDHTGGLPRLLERHTDFNLYCHPAIWQRKRRREGDDAPVEIGIPVTRDEFVSKGVRVIDSTSPCEMAPGVWTLGEIPRDNDWEGGPYHCLVNDDESLTPDSLLDDRSVVLETKAGLAVICGCAHAGLINTLGEVQRLFPGKPIHSVIGGFHLYNVTDAVREKTIRAASEFAPAVFAPCHCSGGPAKDLTRTIMADAFAECHTSAVFTWD